MDTLGNLLALHVTPASERDRAQVQALTQEVKEQTGEHVEVAFVDQGHTGQNAREAASSQGVHLVDVNLDEAKRGFVLLPRRRVVQRSF